MSNECNVAMQEGFNFILIGIIPDVLHPLVQCSLLTLGARVTVVVLCVCPFSLFCFLALLGVQREVSAATARKMQ